MKKSVLILLIILFGYNNKQEAFANTAGICENYDFIKGDTADIERRLVQFKYKRYINKPIGKLLKDINLNYRNILFIQTKPMYLGYVIVVYSDNVQLDIYTERYSYLKRLIDEKETEQVWKVEDLLKEKVTKIIVRNRSGKLLKECPKKPVYPITYG